MKANISVENCSCYQELIILYKDHNDFVYYFNFFFCHNNGKISDLHFKNN